MHSTLNFLRYTTNCSGLNLAINMTDNDKCFPEDACAPGRLSAPGIPAGLAHLTLLFSTPSTSINWGSVVLNSGYWQTDCS